MVINLLWNVNVSYGTCSFDSLSQLHHIILIKLEARLYCKSLGQSYVCNSPVGHNKGPYDVTSLRGCTL